MKTFLYTVVLMTAIAACQSALALNLGRPEVRSHLGEPLSVRIPVSGESADVLRQTQFGLAPYSQWQQAGLKLPPEELDPRVDFRLTGDSPHLQVTTNSPVDEPVLQLLLSYQVNLDPVEKQSFTLFLDPQPSGGEAEADAVAAGAAPPQAEPSTPEPSSSQPSQPEPRTAEPAPEPTTATAQADAPEPEAGMAAQRSSASAADADRYGPVGEGETLWSIAVRYSQVTGARLPDLVQALMDTNPQAFDSPGNPASLIAGSYLEIPDEIPRRSDREAEATAVAGNEAESRPVASGGTQAEAADQETSSTDDSKPWAGADRVGPVGEGETLWSIASRLSRGGEYAPQQFMLGLLAANPDAFRVADNVNSLRHGVRLQVPGPDLLGRYSRAEAVLEVQRQNRDWDSGTVDRDRSGSPDEPSASSPTSNPGVGLNQSDTDSLDEETGSNRDLPRSNAGASAADSSGAAANSSTRDPETGLEDNREPSPASEPSPTADPIASGGDTDPVSAPVEGDNGGADADSSDESAGFMAGGGSDELALAPATTGSDREPPGADSGNGGSPAETGASGGEAGDSALDPEATVNEILDEIEQEQTTSGSGSVAAQPEDTGAGAAANSGASSDSASQEPLANEESSGTADGGAATNTAADAGDTSTTASSDSGESAPWWQFWRRFEDFSFADLDRSVWWGAGAVLVLLIIVVFVRGVITAGSRPESSRRRARPPQADKGSDLADRLVHSSRPGSESQAAAAAAPDSDESESAGVDTAVEDSVDTPGADDESSASDASLEPTAAFDDSQQQEWVQEPAQSQAPAESGAGDADTLLESTSDADWDATAGSRTESEQSTRSDDKAVNETAVDAEEEPVLGIDYEAPDNPFGEESVTSAEDEVSAPVDLTQPWAGPDDTVDVDDSDRVGGTGAGQPTDQDAEADQPGEAVGEAGENIGSRDGPDDDIDQWLAEHTGGGDSDDFAQFLGDAPDPDASNGAEPGDSLAGEHTDAESTPAAATWSDTGAPLMEATEFEEQPESDIDQPAESSGADAESESATGDWLDTGSESLSEAGEFADQPEVDTDQPAGFTSATAGIGAGAESESATGDWLDNESESLSEAGEFEGQPEFDTDQPAESQAEIADAGADAGSESTVDVWSDTDSGRQTQATEPEMEDQPGSESADPAAGAASATSDANYIEVKLDLARAYLSLGDREATESLLDEVLAEGSDRQQQEAREMKNAI